MATRIYELTLLCIILGVINWQWVMYLVEESGPFNIFLRFRKLIGINVEIPGGDEVLYVSNGSMLAEAFSCRRCASPYSGSLIFILGLILNIYPFDEWAIILWLGIIAVGVFLYEWTG